MAAPLPANETERLQALRRYGILDTPPEPCFDRLTALAAEALGAPVALLGFLDRDRLWFKSRRGLDVASVPRRDALGAYTILRPETLVSPDTSLDPRFAANPLVTGPPGIRFYAAAPLLTPDGFPIGTLAAAGPQPRVSLDHSRAAMLEGLAETAMDELELRRVALAGRVSPVPAGFEWTGAMLDAVEAGLSITDDQGLLVWVNQAYCRITGFTEAELAGHDFSRVVPPEHRPLALKLHRRILSGEQLIPAEFWIQRKDGSTLSVHSAAGRLIGPDGRAYRVTALMDVTALKETEECLHRGLKLEAVRRLAGGVSHNFNNLLTVITGYIHLILSSLPPGDPACGHAEKIIDATNRAAAITNQLLAFSRHGIVAPRTLDLNATLAGLETSLRRVLGDEIELIQSLHPDAGCIRMDPEQFERLMLHLAANAREATPGSGRVTIETRAMNLEEDDMRLHPGLQSGRYVLVTVTDTGRGMDRETRGHLFEPFFSTSGVGKGTGLAAVYGMVKQAGGDVSIYSEVGGGTTVGFYLPRREAAAEMTKPEPEPAAAHGETILLVDDEPGIRDPLHILLERIGYQVLAAGSAEEALRLLEPDQPVHLLLADVAMPEITGPELAARLLAERPGMKVLYMSGLPADMAEVVTVPLAGVAFIQKPFSFRKLQTELRTLLAEGGAAKSAATVPAA